MGHLNYRYSVATIPSSRLLAEHVDYDPNTQRFFVSSVRKKKIVSARIDSSGSSSPCLPEPQAICCTKD